MLGSDSGGSWSYSPKQATVPFSSRLGCLLMAGMNIPLHLQKWEMLVRVEEGICWISNPHCYSANPLTLIWEAEWQK